MKKEEKKLSFEEAMDNLEKIVSNLESGELPLDKSLENFKQGVEMVNYCESLLDDAEKTINIYIKNKDGEIEEETFDVS